MPEYIDKNSLVFIISYSGNTEETINMYRNAVRKGCQIVVISSGGVISTSRVFDRRFVDSANT